MKKLVTIMCLSIFGLVESTGLIWSADFNKGLNAARKGDFATALDEWKPLAEQGNVTAQINLGVMYEDGKGVERDYKSAVKWYKLAAEQGDARAQVNLGLMYAKGTGIRLNNIYAHMWFNIAASTSDKDAISNRNIVAQQMKPTEITIAQRLARRCILKAFKGC